MDVTPSSSAVVEVPARSNCATLIQPSTSFQYDEDGATCCLARIAYILRDYLAASGLEQFATILLGPGPAIGHCSSCLDGGSPSPVSSESKARPNERFDLSRPRENSQFDIGHYRGRRYGRRSRWGRRRVGVQVHVCH